MVLSSTNTIFAKEYSEEEKAEVMQKLEILKGNGTSLDLDSELSRAQAATFIVRLLGKEDDVLENQFKYKVTDFDDVPIKEWYAPYVGYCAEQGIINGIDSTTFNPKGNVTEKGFVKLVLTAIGYEYNKDFEWKSVFQKAYSIGLLSNSKYKNGDVKTRNYTRGDVVNILFQALQLNNPKTNIRMAYTLIDNKKITKEEGKKYSLIVDDAPTVVESIKPLNSKSVQVTFNEKVNGLTQDNVVIYQSSGGSEVLELMSIEEGSDSNTYIVNTKTQQKRDEEYTIILDDIIDYQGNPITIDEKFIGYREDELQSDFFRISKVKAVSKNVIEVYFTHPINDNALQASFYTLEKDDEVVLEGNNNKMKISKLAASNKGVSIYLEDYSFDQEDYYKLRVDGKLSSVYGVTLNNGDGDDIRFVSTTDENEAFVITECIPVNSKTLQIDFNKEVNPVLAKQVYQYSVRDEQGIEVRVSDAKVMTDGDNAGMSVRLTLSSSIRVNTQYKVMINYITDVTRQFSIIEKEFGFVGTYYSSNSMKIEGVLPLDNTTLIVYVNEALDEEWTKKIANYQLRGVTNTSYLAIPEAIYYTSEEPYQIKIYLPKDKQLKDDYSYNLRILSLKDSLGNKQSYTISQQFKHSESTSEDLYIKDARVIGDNTIKLTFNKEIDYNIENVMTSNYTLIYTDNGIEYKKIPIGANYINPSTIVLKFDVLNTDYSYQLTFKSLIDYGKNRTDNKDSKYKVEVTLGE